MDNGTNSYRRYLSGDDTGMVEIIRDYKDGLILFLLQFSGDIHTAEDWMEDTFVKLAIKKPAFYGKSGFKTWLYAIARNIARDHLRRHRSLTVVSRDALEKQAEDEWDLEREYLRQEQKIQLHRAISRLKPEYRQVLYLTFFEGFSNEQAGKIMKKTRRQIENLNYRAKQALLSQLEKEGFCYEAL